MKSLIGKKIGMTQIYDEKGKTVPVTVIQAGPCVVVDVKTVERDGYSAVQLGYGERRAKNASKALLGHVAKANYTDKSPVFPPPSATPSFARPKSSERRSCV